MSAVISLPFHQGSDDWHEHRRLRGNASEAAALMGCSPWFPRTPYELWLLKTGRSEKATTTAMRRGLQMEPRARAFLEAVSDDVYEPQVVVRGRLSASLDGLSFDGRTLLEIKCPWKGRDSETWRTVQETGTLPEHYWWQVQQQLYCSGATHGRFVVFHAEGDEVQDMLECLVRPDPSAHEALRGEWDRFFEFLDQDRAPPTSEQDLDRREDVEWRDAVSDWKEAQRWVDEARRAEAAARRRLLEMVDGGRATVGAGVRVTRYWKAGTIDWRRATEGMDLEAFRREGGWRYRISEQE